MCARYFLSLPFLLHSPPPSLLSPLPPLLFLSPPPLPSQGVLRDSKDLDLFDPTFKEAFKKREVDPFADL